MATLAPLLLFLDVRCVRDFVTDPEQPERISAHSSVIVRPASATLEGVGANVQLAGEAVDGSGFVLAGQPIRWRSLNPAIATADSIGGLVTAVGSGQAIIEAQAGSNVLGYALVTVSVSLTPPLSGLDSASGVTSEQLNAVWGTSPANVYAVGTFGTLLHFDGQAWTRINVGLVRHLWGVWGSSATDVYVVGDSGTVLRYDGSDWRQVANVGTTRSLHDVWGASPRDVYVVGDGGTILHSDGRWLADTSGTTASLRGVWGASAEDVWAVGDAGTILHRSASGWAPEPAPSSAVLTDVWGTSAAQVIAVGGGGTALRRSGGRWTAEATGSAEALNAVWGTSAQSAVAVGEGGTLLRFTGSEWQAVAGASGAALHSVFGFSTGDVFLGGGEGTLLATTRATGPRLVFAVVPSQPVAAGVTFPVEVWVVNGTGAKVSTATDTVSLTIADDTSGGQLLGTTSVVAAGGVARFALSVRRADAHYLLSASAPQRATARSPSFAVVPAAATRLTFLVQPSITRRDEVIFPAPRVAAVDSFGNGARNYTRDVAISLGTASPCGALNPLAENTRTPVNGVATFDQLHPSHGGVSCTLVATSAGILDTARSDTFQVIAGGAARVTFVPEAIGAHTQDLLSFAVDVRDLDGNRIPPFAVAATPIDHGIVSYLNDAELPSGTVTGAVAVGTGQTVVSTIVEGVVGNAVVTVTEVSPVDITHWNAQQVSAGRLEGVVSDGAAWFAVGADGAFVSSLGQTGISIAHLGTDSLRAAFTFGDGPVYAVSNAGALLMVGAPSDPSGSTIEKGRVLGVDFRGIWGASPTDLFLVGQGASGCTAVLGCAFVFDGQNLLPGSGLLVNGIADPRAIWGVSRGQLFVPTGGGWGVFGSSYSDCGTTAPLRGVWGTAPNDVFMVGSGGTIVRWNGSGCAIMASPVSEDLYGVAGFGSNDVYAVGAGGTILHYDGVTWTPIVSPTTLTLRAVSAAYQPRIVYAGGNTLTRFAQVVAVGDSGVVVLGLP